MVQAVDTNTSLNFSPVHSDGALLQNAEATQNLVSSGVDEVDDFERTPKKDGKPCSQLGLRFSWNPIAAQMPILQHFAPEGLAQRLRSTGVDVYWLYPLGNFGKNNFRVGPAIGYQYFKESRLAPSHSTSELVVLEDYTLKIGFLGQGEISINDYNNVYFGGGFGGFVNLSGPSNFKNVLYSEHRLGIEFANTLNMGIFHQRLWGDSPYHTQPNILGLEVAVNLFSLFGKKSAAPCPDF